MHWKLVLGAVLFAALAAGAHAQTVRETATVDAIADLDWQIGADIHALPSLNASIRTQGDEALLSGTQAREFLRLAEGHERFRPDAAVLKFDGPLADSFVAYTYRDIGYVRMDDWDEFMDSTDLLEQIRKNTEEYNDARADGYPALHIDGWAEEPFLDRRKAVVYWAIRGHSETGNRFINAKALRLGRKGITDLVWVGSPEQFGGSANVLRQSLQAYRYDDGFAYADFQPGVDAVAAVGVGAIAYQMLTGSSKKGAAAAGAGLLAIVAAFAKKLWIFLLLPFAFAWKGIKRLFTG